MALSQRHRSSIFQKLTPILGAEEAEALLSEFPSNDLDTPATKDFVRAEIAISRAEVQAEFGALRNEMQAEFGALRNEMQGEFAAVRNDMQTDRTEVALLGTRLQAGIEALRTEVADRLRQQIIWIASATAVGMGLAAGIGRL
jgi:hypothetical protein